MTVTSDSATETARAEIAEAAARIVTAFAANDEAAYFATFAPDCSFVFHTDAEIHRTRDEWHAGWRELVAGGWRVESCRTLESFVTLVGDGGVFCHVLETVAGTPDAMETYRERETIVFARDEAGELIAVHEHLSPVPDAGTGTDAGADADESAA